MIVNIPPTPITSPSTASTFTLNVKDLVAASNNTETLSFTVPRSAFDQTFQIMNWNSLSQSIASGNWSAETQSNGANVSYNINQTVNF